MILSCLGKNAPNIFKHVTRSLPCRTVLLAWLTFFLFLQVHGPQAIAQTSQRIVAVVNESMISMRDLNERIRLVLAASGLAVTPANHERLRPQVIQVLIDEHLQLEEARQRRVTVSEAEITAAKRGIEIHNRMQEGAYDQFLKANQISIRTAHAQLRASIAWSKLVNGRFSRIANVTSEEINAVLETFERNLGKPQYRVAEILLAVDDPARENNVKTFAARLVNEIRNGGNFNAIASEFSTSAGAAAGGRIGWVAPGQLAPEIDAVINTLEPKQVSDPIRTRSGYHIIILEDRQIVEAANPMLARVSLKHVLVPLPSEPDEAALATALATARNVATEAAGCADLDRLAEDVKSPVETDLGEFQLGNLSAATREAVADLPVGTASDPIRFPTGIAVMMVCNRVEPPSNIPTSNDIEQQLHGRKLQSLGQRYMRNLRRNAFIEPRL